MNRKPHPSGRPIQRPAVGVKSIWRVPEDGYVTPRLRQSERTNAIGFTARIGASSWNDDHDIDL